MEEKYLHHPEGFEKLKEKKNLENCTFKCLWEIDQKQSKQPLNFLKFAVVKLKIFRNNYGGYNFLALLAVETKP